MLPLCENFGLLAAERTLAHLLLREPWACFCGYRLWWTRPRVRAATDVSVRDVTGTPRRHYMCLRTASERPSLASLRFARPPTGGWSFRSERLHSAPFALVQTSWRSIRFAARPSARVHPGLTHPSSYPLDFPEGSSFPYEYPPSSSLRFARPP